MNILIRIPDIFLISFQAKDEFMRVYPFYILIDGRFILKKCPYFLRLKILRKWRKWSTQLETGHNFSFSLSFQDFSIFSASLVFYI